MMEYQIKKFSELSIKEFYHIVQLRISVFVVEQQCAYQEVDAVDGQAIHTWLQEGKDIIGYTRIIDKGDTVTFGRVLICQKYRGKKLGHRLLKETLAVIAVRYPGKPVSIGAQAHLVHFYERYGFKQISEVYTEDGIPHIKMKLHT